MKNLVLAALAAVFGASPAFAAEGSYDLEVIASDEAGVLYYVRDTQDGRAAALWTDDENADSARLTEGAAADRAYRAAMASLGCDAREPEELRFRLFGISVYAEDEGGSDRARVVINRRGDKSVVVNAIDNGPGGDSARVVIDGADADGARDFIDDIDSAPREMKAEMQAAIGL